MIIIAGNKESEETVINRTLDIGKPDGPETWDQGY